MKLFKHILFLAVAALITACASSVEHKELAIVPNPVSVEYEGRGVVFIPGQVPELRTKVDTTLSEEEYILDTRNGGIVITGGSQSGIYWGAQTLRQITAQCQDGQIPGVLIKDKPAFSYRGAHLDCCRHFFTVKEVEEFIDMIALHKINVFHWHLTDDQGWRAEIKSWPKLTEVGSQRSETLVGHYGSDQYDGIPYGGFYTQDQMREVVDYAAKHHITVIPEIEMPGHASAALAAYPELGCEGKDYKVQTTWGVFPEVFCVGKEDTFRLLESVLDEICDIFPSEYIHIGGDEAPRDAWKTCKDCQKLMKAQGYESEAQLQSYLVDCIEKYLNAKGRRIIGWDEILEGGVSTTATVMSWRGADGGIAAAKLGNDVIMTPNSYFYLDYYQTDNPSQEPLAIGGCLPLDKCYSFNPFDGLDEEQRAHIKGIQCNLWTEYIASFDHVQHMELPRLAALAEIAWSNDNRTDYDSFVSRVRQALLPMYEEYGYAYAPYAFEQK